MESDRLETLISPEEEEEEEDVDFNPLLKEAPSREPSSSLSSDVETLDPREEEDKEETASIPPKVSPPPPPQGSKEAEAEEDDAICKRTRARYSLESFTLDDLEAFLQETDDEDDIPNVDDEEEYRKFLAAVLHIAAPEVHSVHDDDDDDEEEDNDLDFEIELEEALETDDDEPIPENNLTADGTKRPVMTRQKRKQKDSSPEQQQQDNNSLLLRPILPVVQPVRMLLPAPPESLASSSSSSANSRGIGFTRSQLGELHCLLQDHLQLLIQVYSLCALDHSRRNIGAQVHGLISEMIQVTHLRSASPVLDTLNLAGRYLTDVSIAVQEYRRCQVESGFDALAQRVPLFPLPLQHINTPPPPMPSSPHHQQQPKKTLAGALVESAKKQSVALVHKDIAMLARRFLPLFKGSLYPHKPPAAAVSNRFLFTDAEDELLALGIMEYNSDWKAIKQRFLPCKGENQIYIRQKNRRSSKAPENPIKAVLRMKSSPLTPPEIERIEEGLRYFKFDWMSVWKFIVPYRDPSLLPRQLRTALGIQKSYKQDDDKKEKRRLNDSKRRMSREQPASAKEDRHGASKANENHVGHELVENSGDTYLHEGFLADWRPGMPTLFCSTSMHSFGNAKNVLRNQPVPTCTGEGSKTAQTLTDTRMLAPGTSRAPIIMHSYHRARRLRYRSVVRLAPDLPPLNLPPSVRVISQSAFAKNQSETSSKTCTAKGGMSSDSGRAVLGTEPPCLSADGDSNGPPCEKDLPAESSSGMGETDNDSDLQMHPLLFRTPEHGQISCYPSNRDKGGSSAFSFFSDNRPQLLSLFNSPRQINHSSDQLQKKTSSNDQEAALGDSCFHPLLQRTECETSYSGRGNLDTSIGKKRKLFQDTSSAVEKTCIPGATRNDRSLKSVTSNKHAKNVNSEINPSPRSSKEKDCGSVSAANISEVPDISMTEREDGSEMPGSTATSDRCIDEMADQSNLGIVMEQEELSDSDEETMEEEHVEFECEEMADSEGEEGSDCEEIIETQDKDNRSSAVEVTSTDVGSGKELGRDSPSSPWLSLDPSSRPSCSKVRDIGKTEPADKTKITQFGSSRSRRKRTPKSSRDAESKEDVGVARAKLLEEETQILAKQNWRQKKLQLRMKRLPKIQLNEIFCLKGLMQLMLILLRLEQLVSLVSSVSLQTCRRNLQVPFRRMEDANRACSCSLLRILNSQLLTDYQFQ
ncbi:Homeodomain-like superfamily protein [Hirschfeldia incana]|nr:Homeodomain-like superfamily protein [Hirschfeldia incana]